MEEEKKKAGAWYILDGHGIRVSGETLGQVVVTWFLDLAHTGSNCKLKFSILAFYCISAYSSLLSTYLSLFVVFIAYYS